MNKLMVGSIAMFLLAGCGAEGEGPSEPGPITSVGAIAGTWHQTSSAPWYIQIFEDGTMNGSSTRENVEDRPTATHKLWFEGGQLFLESTSLSPGCEENTVGIYEVYALENGNLQFVAIEDECAPRQTSLYGRPDDGITREYEPVPSDSGIIREY